MVLEIFYEVSFVGATSVAYINFYSRYGMILATCAQRKDSA